MDGIATLSEETATAAEVDSYKTRILGGRYLIILEQGRLVVKLVPGGATAAPEEIYAAVEALMLREKRWQAALGVTLTRRLKEVATDNAVDLLRLVRGLRPLVLYARHLTQYHPRAVLTISARMAVSGYQPGERPWAENTPRPTVPRLRRFPPAISNTGRYPYAAAQVLILGMQRWEQCSTISWDTAREEAFVNAAAELVLDEALATGGVKRAPPAQNYVIALFLALGGREFEEATSNLPPPEVDHAACMLAADTLAQLHFRQAPALLTQI